ncbi:BID domain-containing T4SS effector [Bartonella sp. B23]
MEKKHLSPFSSRTPGKTEKQHAATSLNLESAQAVTTQQELTFLKERIVDKVKCSPLVEVYAEGIQRWSKTVYGSKNILHTETKKILEDPAMGASLLKRVTEHPASIHSLAGIEIFGFKTKARKNAESAVSHLSSAIDGYMKAVDYTYKGMNITAPVENKVLERSLQESLAAGKREASLSSEVATGLIRNNVSVQKDYLKLKYWSRIVYDNPDALQKPMEDILKNPAMGEQLLWTLKANPTSFHKFAGRSVCGIKNGTRRCAESHLSNLCSAFEDYILTAKEAKEFILHEQETQQRCIKAPEGSKQKVEQRVQQSKERQHSPQHEVQQHRAKSGKGMAFAM